MSRIFSLILILCTVSIQAQTLDSLFVKANKLYQQEKYSDALELYAKIESDSIVSDALFFNMANSYFKTNQVAPSIYYYEKALAISPSDKDILFNLDYANRMIIDDIEPLPKSISDRFRENVIMKFTYNTWATLSVVFALLFAFLFLMYHFSNSTSTKRFYFVASIIVAIIVFMNVLFGYQNRQIVKSTRYAIVFSSSVQVKSAPTKSSEFNFELHEGSKVQIIETLDNWRKIKIADGNFGWIDQQDIKEY